MPRIAVKHPSGVHRIYSTVVEDFLCGAFATEQLAEAYTMMARQDIPLYQPSFVNEMLERGARITYDPR